MERALLALRVPEHAARLLAATPSLRLSWLLAEAMALGFAVLAANVASGNDADVVRFLFLVVAALLPVAGIAAAFGPGVDPAYEIGAAAPMRADVLLAMRALAVLTTSLVDHRLSPPSRCPVSTRSLRHGCCLRSASRS